MKASEMLESVLCEPSGAVCIKGSDSDRHVVAVAIEQIKDIEAYGIIKKEKPVYVAWTNTDLTEGKGARIPKAICEIYITAYRLGKRGSVQGCDCEITKEKAYLIGRYWYVPGRIIRSSKEDDKKQKLMDEKEAALKKARDAGLSDDDIEILRR